MSDFPWREYDCLCEELRGAAIAWDSWHRSMTNLEYTGFDEHGVEPGEEGIYNRAMAEIREKIKALGTPPKCVVCRGSGTYYYVHKNQFGEVIDVDEWPSTCYGCGGDGEYRGEDDGLG